jgi:hypothetical protein
MRYVNPFMRSYKVIMVRQLIHAKYMRKMQFEKIIKQHHERLLKIEKKNNKN